MKNIYILLLLAGGLLSCTKEDHSPYAYTSESTIYSQSETTSFQEILFTIHPFVISNGQKEYVVADKITNIAVRVNNSTWGTFESMIIDTAKLEKSPFNNYMITDKQMNYTVIAAHQTEKDILTTAGEYADLINRYLTLKPGDYFCQIDSFDLKLKSGQVKKVYPFISVPLQVKENVRSAFIGEFEVQIK